MKTRVFCGVREYQCRHCQRWNVPEDLPKTKTKRGFRAVCRPCLRTQKREQRRARRGQPGAHVPTPRLGERRRVTEGQEEFLCTRCFKWNPRGEMKLSPKAPFGVIGRCLKCVRACDRQYKILKKERKFLRELRWALKRVA